MNACDAMNPAPSTLKPTDSIKHAAEFILKHRYRSVPVVDDDYCYVGMFGVNCLLKQVIPKSVLMTRGLSNIGFIHESFEEIYARFAEVMDKPISYCMNNEIVPVAPDTPLTETLLQLFETHASIPVVEHESCKLLGVITYWDIGEKILSVGERENA